MSLVLVLRRSFCIMLLVISFPAVGQLASADDKRDFTDAIEMSRRMARALYESARIPGLSVAVGKGDEIVWAEGFGLANLETPSPVTPSTRFRAASVSKVLTVAALARLAARGSIDIDAPIQKYVPSFPAKEGTITARLLAGHLAGIRHYVGADFANDFRHYDSLRDAVPIFASSDPVAMPGTKYVYSTFGYTLLGAALEEAAKTDFLALMDREVFRPLDMRDSGGDVPAAIISGRTTFFERGRDGKLVHADFVDPSYKYPGGGLLTTPSDLVRFGLAHLTTDYLPARLIDEMFTSQKLTDGKETGVGIGWRIGEDWKGRRIVHHSGSMSGARSSIIIYPDQELVVSFMSNVSGYPAFAEDTLQMLAEPFLEEKSMHAEEALPSGTYSYTGQYDNSSAEGVIVLEAGSPVEGFISVPEAISSIFRSNGAPDSGSFPIVTTFEKSGSVQIVIATPYGLLPIALERTATGFRGLLNKPRRWEIEARQVTKPNISQ